ncbi:class I SAM-dependent DNA methyltransferase [Streptomyces halstedii]|uniref:class I SAM-dependent DNA methyltransferase n=1 Tax=Streptomyces halstedii TaxID=1944 RepID=UPI00380F0425
MTTTPADRATPTPTPSPVDQAVSADHAAVAYDATAPFYDSLTRHDNYDVFADLLEGLIKQAGPAGTRLLDAGCGTGRSSVLFAGRGYRVTGFDISASMIGIARTRHADSGIDFHVHDIRRPAPGEGPYDVVLCMSDIVNYLVDPAHLAEAFARLSAAMAPGGVLVFDANTALGYDLMREPHIVRDDGLFAVLTGKHLASGGRYQLTMDAFRAEAGTDHWTRSTVEHHQAHHSQDRFATLLEAAGLRLTARHGLHISGSLSDGVDESAHTKGLYAAVKPPTA